MMIDRKSDEITAGTLGLNHLGKWLYQSADNSLLHTISPVSSLKEPFSAYKSINKLELYTKIVSGIIVLRYHAVRLKLRPEFKTMQGWSRIRLSRHDSGIRVIAENMVRKPEKMISSDHGKSPVSAIHQEVIPWIRDRIIEGKLAPGSRIPERVICEELNISRTPLREAFKVLAAERLITLTPNRGAVVTRLSFKDVDDAMKLMAYLEGFAGKLLCESISKRQIDHLHAMHDSMVEFYRAENHLDYFKVNRQIHLALLEAADNEILLQTYLDVSARFMRFRYAGNRAKPRWDRAVKEHEQILISIEARDSELLECLLRAHVKNGWAVAREMIREELEGAG